MIKFIKDNDSKLYNWIWFGFYGNSMFVFNETHYYKTYDDHLKMNHGLYRCLNLESNVTIEYWDVEFFVNLITKNKKFEIPTNEEPCEEGSPRIVETQIESSSLMKNLVRKILHGLLKNNLNLE